MSHVVTIEGVIRDADALRAASRRLGLTDPAWETAQLFSGEATGYCIQLPGWRYAVVCDPASGQVKFDNYEGRWGKQCELDRLMQAYAAEKTKLEAHRQGHAVTEVPLDDGSIKVTIHVGGVT